MIEDLGYGLQISDEEYDRQIVELQTHLPPMPSRDQEKQLRRDELALAIDHRLGINFPKERRDALWVIMERVEHKRLRMTVKYAIRNFLKRSAIPKGLAGEANGIAGFMVDLFSEVLNEKELRSFFGLEKGERPSLPLPTRNK